MMSFNKSKLLALLLLLVYTVSLCLSAPTTSLSPISHESHSLSVRQYIPGKYPLSKRKPRMSYEEYQKKLFAKDTKTVDQDEHEFYSFEPKDEIKLGSAGFVGCIGVVIISPKGAIIGHYGANPKGQNLYNSGLPELIEDHRNAFSEGVQAWVYAHVRYRESDEFVSAEYKNELVDLISKNLHIEAKVEKYIEPEDLLMDENGEVDIENEDAYADLKAGGFLVMNPGGGSSASELVFVNLEWQIDHVPPELRPPQ